MDIAGAYWGGGAGWALNPAHFAERHGLIVIIALGESIVAIGAGASALPLSLAISVTALLGLTVAACLWWVYFDITALAAERNLSALTGAARNRAARDAYSVMHWPMIAGIVLLALGVKKTVTMVGTEPFDLAGHIKPLAAISLAGGVALYLTGHLLFRARMDHSWSRPRAVAAAVCRAGGGRAVRPDHGAARGRHRWSWWCWSTTSTAGWAGCPTTCATRRATAATGCRRRAVTGSRADTSMARAADRRPAVGRRPTGPHIGRRGGHGDQAAALEDRPRHRRAVAVQEADTQLHRGTGPGGDESPVDAAAAPGRQHGTTPQPGELRAPDDVQACRRRPPRPRTRPPRAGGASDQRRSGRRPCSGSRPACAAEHLRLHGRGREPPRRAGAGPTSTRRIVTSAGMLDLDRQLGRRPDHHGLHVLGDEAVGRQARPEVLRAHRDPASSTRRCGRRSRHGSGRGSRRSARPGPRPSAPARVR